MIQLSFEPAYDAYHAIFRHLRLRDLATGENGLPIDQFRILDYYLMFPFRLEQFRLKRGHGRYRAMFRRLAAEPRYVEHPSDKMVFERMRPIQDASLQTLAQKQLFDLACLEDGVVRSTAAPLPENTAERIERANEGESELMEFLNVLARDYPLLGPDGLKDRSGLMEYRYDAL